MDNGYLALFRKIEDSFVYQDSELLHLWIHCLIKASYIDRCIMFDGVEIELKKGQFITGRRSLAKALKTTEQKIRSRLALLEKHNQIVVKSTNKYSVITVVKYSYYQTGSKKITNREPTDNQQITTNNKVNKVNNDVSEQSSEELKANQENDMGFQKYSDDYEDEVQVDPDFQPEKPKKKKGASEAIQSVFNLFNNPAKNVWYLRPLERESAKVLLDTYGLETLKRRIDRIELEKKKNPDDPFFPLVVTPSQLLDKMEAVERYLKNI